MPYLEKLQRTPFRETLCINAIFLLLFIMLGSCKFSSMDDFFMSSILSGAYGGENDVHLYFVKVVYGLLLKPFYHFFPSVGWYYIFEVIEVFASFVALVYVLLARLGTRNGRLLSILLLCCFSPVFYYEMDFTKNAAILTAAGILLMYEGDSRNVKYLVSGIAFLCMGFVMRSEAFYLGIPCFAMLIVFRGLIKKKIPIANLIAVVFCCLINAGIFHYDKSFYQNEEYKYYAQYQGPRAVFGDGRYYNYETTLDEIEERGLHGVDFEMLTNWGFYDTEVLAKDSLYKFIQIVDRNHHEVVPTKVPIAVAKELSRCLHEIPSWYWILLCSVIAYFGKGLFRLVPWSSLGYVICAYIYLLLVNRIVAHVEASVWLYATIILFPILKKDDLDKIWLSVNMKKILIGVFILLYVIGFWGTKDYVKAETFQSTKDNRWEAFMLYEREHSDQVFLMDLTMYKRFGSRLGGSFRTLDGGRLNHIIPLGYWNIHLPSIKQLLNERGIENPFKSIADSNVYVVHYDQASLYSRFWELHYGKKILWKNVMWSNVPGREFFSFDVTKFYLQEKQHEK